MADQIVLAWEIDVTGTTFGPAKAATALGAVELYQDPTNDPVLGQLFGLTVASDNTTTPSGSTARRTLTLNMNAVNTPTAPPPFPCRPRTSTPPTLPYPLLEAVTLPGSFFVTNGSMTVATSVSEVPSLSIGDIVQFLSQEGVPYEVASVGATTIGLTAPYSGVTGNTGGFKEIAEPVTIAALYSSSDLDTGGVSTTPAIPAGSGARTVTVTYDDSAGSGPFTSTVTLTGRRPAAVPLAMGSVDIAEIQNIVVASSGGFGNNVGEITLVELSSALPAIPANATPGTGIGAGQGDRTFFALTDEAQLLISRHLAYLPPSYFAIAQPGASAPALSGDFIVTTGSDNVPTTVDQTSTLSNGDEIEFASQRGTIYTIAAVTPKIVTLTAAYSGIDDNNTGLNNVGTNSNAGTQGNIGTSVIAKRTGAVSRSITAAPPSNDELSGPLAQFVAPETAAPPPSPPLSPSTVPAPTFLSDHFTQTLQLALAGIPITPLAVAFA